MIDSLTMIGMCLGFKTQFGILKNGRVIAEKRTTAGEMVAVVSGNIVYDVKLGQWKNESTFELSVGHDVRTEAAALRVMGYKTEGV